MFASHPQGRSTVTIPIITVFTSRRSLTLRCIQTLSSFFFVMHPSVRKGAISVAFVRPSVRPFVAYIWNNSRTQRPSVPKFSRKVPHLWCDSRTSFKVKRSKVKVTRHISGDKHRTPYLPNGKAYELQSWYTDKGRRSAWATRAMTSKVKGQGRKVTWSVWAVLAQGCTCVIRGRQGHTVSAEPGGHTSC